MRNSQKLRTESEMLKMEAINRILYIIVKYNKSSAVTIDFNGDSVSVGMDGMAKTPFCYLTFNDLIKILETLETMFEIGKIVNPNADPSYELVEKYAEVMSLRYDSHEDHKEAYYTLKEQMQTGEITEQYILDEYEKLND